MASTYIRQLQNIVADYQEAGNPWPASARAIAAWVVKNRLWTMQDSDIINKCADEIARAMREEYYTDAQGRRVRAKHCATVEVSGEQMRLWDNHQTATRDFMEIAAKNRRQQIVGDCRQLKTDVDSFNENKSPEEPIKMLWDFTPDVEEAGPNLA